MSGASTEPLGAPTLPAYELLRPSMLASAVHRCTPGGPPPLVGRPPLIAICHRPPAWRASNVA
eukprot:CAMPEP_0174701100 /NCGR_PEP_ID=MMETSP1094-20130205/5849_1 /TAXON_ID=156173 /ORGANISM="Chrysochromulina brevifilum, Strain UTEX LB 985" /LENGTH=62 /DNA_ID=CAMNT_0015898695 /DNA_START=323 /DNA_END=509 /DNA_ORIENTATION=-